MCTYVVWRFVNKTAGGRHAIERRVTFDHTQINLQPLCIRGKIFALDKFRRIRISDFEINISVSVSLRFFATITLR